MNISKLRDLSSRQRFVKDLTVPELEAVLGYKDLTNEQFKWDYIRNDVELSHNLGADCFMLNNYRRRKLHQPISKKDEGEILRRISLINSAIDKSIIIQPTTVYRGYSNPKYMKQYDVGDIFVEEAFTSTSERRESAEKYAVKKSVSEPIISRCRLLPNTNAIYLGKDENEWLLKTDCVFTVTKIKPTKIRGKQGLLYYVRKEI